MLAYASITLFVVLIAVGGQIFLGPQLANVSGTVHNAL